MHLNAKEKVRNVIHTLIHAEIIVQFMEIAKERMRNVTQIPTFVPHVLSWFATQMHTQFRQVVPNVNV